MAAFSPSVPQALRASLAWDQNSYTETQPSHVDAQVTVLETSFVDL